MFAILRISICAALAALLCLFGSSHARAASGLTCETIFTSGDRPTSERSRAQWKAIDSSYTATFKETMSRQIPRMKTMAAIQDPYYLRVVELGFDFENQRVPTLKQLSDRINARFDHYVARGVVKENEVLRPALVFSRKNPDGTLQFKFLRVDEEIPSGFALYGRQILPQSVFFKMLRKGYFPIGKNSIIEWADESTVDHDLAHFSVFMKYPELMSGTRLSVDESFVKILSARGGTQSLLARRYYYLTEIAYAVDPSIRGTALSAMGLRHLAEGQILNVDLAQAQLKTASFDEVDQQAKVLTGLFWSVIRNMGGTSADVHARMDDIYISQDTVYRDYMALTEYLGKSKTARRSGLANAKKDLARFAVNLYNFSFVQTSDWLESVRDLKKPGSILTRAICESGSWVPGDRIYRAFCQ